MSRPRTRAKLTDDVSPANMVVEDAPPPKIDVEDAPPARVRSGSQKKEHRQPGAMSLAQQIEAITPEFRALVRRCTLLREFLDALVPCPHPREVCCRTSRGAKRTPCNRAGCWIRTATLTDYLQRLLETSGVPYPKHMGGPKQVARRCMVLRVLELRDAHPVGSDVWLNLCGEGGEGEVPGFLCGPKQMSQTYLVEYMLRGPDGEPLRNVQGVKAEVEKTYKAAAICGLQIRTTNPVLIEGYNAAVARTNDKGGRKDKEGAVMSVNGHDAFWDPMLGIDGACFPVGGGLFDGGLGGEAPKRRAETPAVDARTSQKAKRAAPKAEVAPAEPRPASRSSKRKAAPKQSYADDVHAASAEEEDENGGASGDEFSLLRCDEALEGAPAPKAAKAEARAAAPDVATLLALLRSKDDELAARAEELAATKSKLAQTTCQLQQAQALIELMTTTPNPTMSPPRLPAADEEVADLTVAAAAGSCHLPRPEARLVSSPVFGHSGAASPVDDDAELFSAGDLDLAGCLSD